MNPLTAAVKGNPKRKAKWEKRGWLDNLDKFGQTFEVYNAEPLDSAKKRQEQERNEDKNTKYTPKIIPRPKSYLNRLKTWIQ